MDRAEIGRISRQGVTDVSVPDGSPDPASVRTAPLLGAASANRITESATLLTSELVAPTRGGLRDRGFLRAADIAAELGADRVLSRTYVDESARRVGSVLVLWHQSQRAGKSQPHSPKMCLPESGWIPDVTGEVTLDAADAQSPSTVIWSPRAENAPRFCSGIRGPDAWSPATGRPHRYEFSAGDLMGNHGRRWWRRCGDGCGRRFGAQSLPGPSSATTRSCIPSRSLVSSSGDPYPTHRPFRLVRGRDAGSSPAAVPELET